MKIRVLTVRAATGVAAYASAQLLVLIGLWFAYQHFKPIRSSSTILDSSIGHWRMGEAARWDGANWTIPDQTASPANGTSVNLVEADRVTGAPLTAEDPSYGMNLHGYHQSYVDIGSPDKLNLTESLTVTAWVKPAGIGSAGAHPWFQPIVGKGDNQYMLRYCLPSEWLTSHAFAFFTHDSTGWHEARTSLAHPGGSWYFVVGRVDSSTANSISIFVNGVLEAQTSGEITPDDDASVTIGRNSNSSGLPRVFNGVIDEVKIYDYALSEGEIQALYSERISP